MSWNFLTIVVFLICNTSLLSYIAFLLHSTREDAREARREADIAYALAGEAKKEADDALTVAEGLTLPQPVDPVGKP